MLACQLLETKMGRIDASALTQVHVLGSGTATPAVRTESVNFKFPLTTL